MATRSTRPVDAPPRAVPEVASLRSDQRARHQRLVQTAVRVMARVDYDRIQVKEVADEAHVALGTLYRYFSSKDHLFACALLEWSAGFEPRARSTRAARPVDRVTRVYTMAARAFEREPRIYDVLVQLQGSNDPHARAVYAEFAQRQSAAFAAALSDLDTPDRDDIVDVMSAVLSEALRGRQRGGLSPADVRSRIERAAELLLR
jgi:AcrR family transcriptional regulator